MARTVQKYHFAAEYQIADGGETRFHSVRNGLACIPDDETGVVGIHDGVRPFPSIEVISNCYETARTRKAVVPVTPVVETLIHLNAETRAPPCQDRSTALYRRRRPLTYSC